MSRAPFGLALQGVRDNPRRMAALGFNVTAHRIAAYAFASVIAAVGGILLVWQNAQISPGTVGHRRGDRHPGHRGRGRHHAGPSGRSSARFIYVLLRTFSPDVLAAFGLSGERFKLLIGLGFLAIVFFSPDGVLGPVGALARRGGRRPRSADGGRHDAWR